MSRSVLFQDVSNGLSDVLIRVMFYSSLHALVMPWKEQAEHPYGQIFLERMVRGKQSPKNANIGNRVFFPQGK